jgi:hypothetical protein
MPRLSLKIVGCFVHMIVELVENLDVLLSEAAETLRASSAARAILKTKR